MANDERFISGRAVLLLAAAVASLALFAAAEAPPVVADADADPVGPAVRVHRDADGLRKATISAAAALLREDGRALAVELAAMKRASPALAGELAETLGSEIRGYDASFHTTLSRARENVADEDLGEAFDTFFWLERTCRSCHASGRELGLLPASGPLWKPVSGDADP